MNIGELAGYLGALFATITFLPQLIKTLKTKETKNLSLLMIVFAIMGNIMWIIHGLSKDSFPLIGSSILILFLTIPLLYLKFKNIRNLK
ncbi:hypothetical protein CRV00_11960 [Malaciobacter molluscorum]|uniref:SemiSWEET family sugar transporter n=1 Tax=Malaciobacter molluscorum TaxID=1032072 RepID=UPI00100AC35A|nr:SemiSWEET family transporter [Malaciobacter molluscorum]RXJ92856.1 hypothetical protein CRV00_11960 [Malaciobacter molluscorum]